MVGATCNAGTGAAEQQLAMPAQHDALEDLQGADVGYDSGSIVQVTKGMMRKLKHALQHSILVEEGIQLPLSDVQVRLSSVVREAGTKDLEEVAAEADAARKKLDSMFDKGATQPQLARMADTYLSKYCITYDWYINWLRGRLSKGAAGSAVEAAAAAAAAVEASSVPAQGAAAGSAADTCDDAAGGISPGAAAYVQPPYINAAPSGVAVAGSDGVGLVVDDADEDMP
jgi:hypothetical protein